MIVFNVGHVLNSGMTVGCSPGKTETRNAAFNAPVDGCDSGFTDIFGKNETFPTHAEEGKINI